MPDKDTVPFEQKMKQLNQLREIHQSEQIGEARFRETQLEQLAALRRLHLGEDDKKPRGR